MEYYQGNSLKSSQKTLLLQLRLKDMIRRESTWHSHPENFPVKKKLFLYLREVAGPRNGSIQDSDIFPIILRVLKSYWDMAGFPTLISKEISSGTTTGSWSKSL